MTLLQHYQFSLILTTVVTATVGLWVFIQRRNSKVAQFFCLYSLVVAFWSWCQTQGGSSDNPTVSLLWIRAMFYVVIAFPVLLTHFFSTFLRVNQRKACLLGWILVVGFLPFGSSDQFLRQSGPLGFLPAMPRAGPLFLPFNMVWFGWILYDWWLLGRGPLDKTGPTRKQVNLLLAAFVFGYLTGCTNYLYFYGICLPPLQPFANYGVPIAFWIIAYGVFTYGLFDIQVVIRRSILYSILLAFIIAGYFGLVYTLQWLFHMTLLQHHILALGLTALTTSILGLVVFLAEPKRRLNQIFGLYSLAISGWSFTEAFLYGSKSQLVANVWAYVEWPPTIFIAPTFIHTVFLLTEADGRKAKGILTTAYAVSFMVLFLHLFTNLIAAPPRPVGYSPFVNSLNAIGFLIPFTFFIIVNIALWKLLSAYRKATGQHRTQLKYLFWGSLIGYLGGSPDWFLTFGFYIPFVNPFGIYGVPLYSIATTYAVLQHKLFDVNVVIRKSLVYSILVTALTIGYFGLIYGIERIFRTAWGYQSIWLSLTAFALMAFLFQPLKIWIQRLVDWLIFRVPQEAVVKRMERLEQGAQQTEKLRAVATLAAGLCHELRNPLQVIQTHAEFLPERYDDPSFREKCCEVMKTETARINNLLKQLMDFARPKPPALRPVEPHKILDSTLDLLGNDFVTRQVHLEKRYEANGLKMQADPDQLRQVILNLVLNALQAIGHEGKVTVTTHQENGWFTLEVADTGPGIDPKILPKLFEPFASTKPDGTGLGLSIVHSIIKEHRGKITVQSQPGQGATFTLRFPM